MLTLKQIRKLIAEAKQTGEDYIDGTVVDARPDGSFLLEDDNFCEYVVHQSGSVIRYEEWEFDEIHKFKMGNIYDGE